jgi:hypothetical protein
MTIVHCTLYFDNNLEKCGNFLKEQLKLYCKKYKLEFSYSHTPIGDIDKWPTWQKIFRMKYLLSQIREGDWVVCFDADMAIINPNINIKDLILSCKKDVLISKDWNGLCTAVMAVKNTKFGRDLLDSLCFLSDIDSKFNDGYGVGCGDKHEQNCLKTICKYFPFVSNGIDFFDNIASDNPDFNNPPLFWHYGSANSLDKKEWILDNIVYGKTHKTI